MSNHAQEFANAKRSKMKDANKAAGLITRGPGMGSIANNISVQELPNKAEGDDFTDMYKLDVADLLTPANADGSPRAARHTLLKESVNARRMIGNAFNGEN